MLRVHRPFHSPCAHVRSLPASPASSLPHVPSHTPLSCETFRREPATRQLVWSFAPTPTSRQRVEHQYSSGPPPAFPPASACAGVVRCLSGPMRATHRSPTTPMLPMFVSLHTQAPWSVFQYGPESSAVPRTFTFHHPSVSFHTSLALLILYRSRRVFSLRCLYHRFVLHYQAALLFPRAYRYVYLRGCHPLWPRFPSG